MSHIEFAVLAVLMLVGMARNRAAFRSLSRKVSGLMSNVTDIKQLVTQINEETNGVAERLAAIEAQLPKPGDEPLTAEDAADLKAQLTAEVARLQGLGADPTNPIPETPTDV